MRLFAFSVLGAAALSLAACDTTSTSPYVLSAPNVVAFQGALKGSGSSVQLSDFSASGGVESPGCRLVGGMDVTAGKTIPQYVHDAMQQELFTAGVYDAKAPVAIMANVNSVKLNTFGTGSWTLSLSVKSSRDAAGYTVEIEHKFRSSYMATSACKNAADAFGPAVSDLIHEVVSNPEFGKLVGPPSELGSNDPHTGPHPDSGVASAQTSPKSGDASGAKNGRAGQSDHSRTVLQPDPSSGTVRLPQ